VKLTGAQALIQSLCDHGTEIVFGIPGGVMIPGYDALYDCKDLKHMLMRHEQGAAHAADGTRRHPAKWASASPRPGLGQPISSQGLLTRIWTRFRWWLSPDR